MRMYLMSWGNGYHSQDVRVCPETDINEDTGYSEEDIEALEALEPGEAWTSGDLASHCAILIPEGTSIVISEGETK